MERILNNTTIVKNLFQRYLALAEGHFDEVFVKEFVSDDNHKRMLLSKVKRALQKQILLADVVFGAQTLPKECYDALVELVKHTQAFWHELCSAIQESSTDQAIGEQQPTRKAVAVDCLRRMSDSANALSLVAGVTS